MYTHSSVTMCSRVAQLGSGAFSKVLADEGSFGLRYGAMVKHSGDLGNKSFIPAVPCLGRWWWTCPSFWWLLPGAEPG